MSDLFNMTPEDLRDLFDYTDEIKMWQEILNIIKSEDRKLAIESDQSKVFITCDKIFAKISASAKYRIHRSDVYSAEEAEDWMRHMSEKLWLSNEQKAAIFLAVWKMHAINSIERMIKSLQE